MYAGNNNKTGACLSHVPVSYCLVNRMPFGASTRSATDKPASYWLFIYLTNTFLPFTMLIPF